MFLQSLNSFEFSVILGIFFKDLLWILNFDFFLYISRSEQVTRCEFHPYDKSDKINCFFFLPHWCNKKVNPETQVPCGSYELLLSNVAHQMKEKLMIQAKKSLSQSRPQELEVGPCSGLYLLVVFKITDK